MRPVGARTTASANRVIFTGASLRLLGADVKEHRRVVPPPPLAGMRGAERPVEARHREQRRLGGRIREAPALDPVAGIALVEHVERRVDVVTLPSGSRRSSSCASAIMRSEMSTPVIGSAME